MEKKILYDRAFYSYGQVLGTIDHLFNFLKATPVPQNEIIAISLNHGLAYISSIFAIYRNNGTTLFLNPKQKKTELEEIILSAQVNFIITDAKSACAFDPTAWRVTASPLAETCLLQRIQSLTPKLQFIEPKFLIYTSGSTGSPSGVILNEYTLSANIKSVNEYLGLTPDDSSIIYTPPGYVYAINQTICHLDRLALQHSYSHGLAFPNDLADLINKESITGFATNPTGLRLITDPKRCDPNPLISVRYVMTGGQPLTKNLFLKIKEKFPKAAVINTYGCTETSARISCWTCPDLASSIDSEPFPVGYPITATKIKITDDDGYEVTDGIEGHVYVTGPTLMEGYLDKANVRTEPLNKGWFKTGDMGTYSNSYGLTLTGRADDIILSGHNKVSPVEIETLLENLNEISEVAITSAPDEILGNRIIAAIVLNYGADEDTVIKNCRILCNSRLSSFKHPEEYIFIKEIPKNLYGKIDRKALIKAINR